MKRTDPLRLLLAAEAKNNPAEAQGLLGSDAIPLRLGAGSGESGFFCDLSAEQEFEDLLWETGLLGPERP